MNQSKHPLPQKQCLRNMQNYVSGWMLITVLPGFVFAGMLHIDPADPVVFPRDLWIFAGFTSLSLFGYFYCIRPKVCINGTVLVVTNPVFETRVGLGRVVTVRDAFCFPRLVLDDRREIVLWALEETNVDYLRGLDRAGVLGNMIAHVTEESDRCLTRRNILFKGPLLWFTIAMNASYLVVGFVQTIQQ